MSLSNTVEKLARREISSSEITDICLAKIAELDGKLGAFVSVFEKEARDAARTADALRSKGAEVGPLHGIPVAVKDLFHVRGHETRAGTRSHSIPPDLATAAAVRKLTDAGMIVIGKTHTDEFAYGAWGVNRLYSSPWNPYDMETHRVAGGSSSGSAVAVSAGLVPFALGSDTGGSARVPASFCGCVGVKPSFGSIDRKGMVPLSPSLDVVGFFANTIGDAALLFDVLADADKAGAKPKTRGGGERRGRKVQNLEGVCIGFLPTQFLQNVNSDILRLYEMSLDALRSSGATMTEFRPPRPFSAYLTDTVSLVSAEIYTTFGQLAEKLDSEMQPFIRERILDGKAVSAAHYSVLLNRRNDAIAEMRLAMDDFDALVTPTCAGAAIPVAEVDLTAPATPFARFVNYLDLAGLSLPCGLTRAGLPAGVQVVVKRFDDRRMFEVGACIEKTLGKLQPSALGNVWR
nr:amidase [uncultured Roseibium sp.]